MTRNEILGAAAEIISAKGYEATSMQDIADAVSLQKASLYYHFESKQEILFALLDRALDLLTSRLEDVRNLPLSPDEKLRLAMSAFLEVIASEQHLASILLLEYRSLAPELRRQHVLRRDRVEQLWRDLIIEGLEAGIFECHEPSLAGRAILSMLNWTVTWYRNDGPKTAKEIADQFTDLFLKGLLVRRDD